MTSVVSVQVEALQPTNETKRLLNIAKKYMPNISFFTIEYIRHYFSMSKVPFLKYKPYYKTIPFKLLAKLFRSEK
jgi:hypothetical protein